MELVRGNYPLPIASFYAAADTHRSSHQPGPERELAPRRRLEAHGRASFRLSERVPGPGLDGRSQKIARALADFALLWGARPPNPLFCQRG